MLRIFGIFGLGGIFMMISPKLRTSLNDSLVGAVDGLDRNQPYSYVALAVVVLGLGMIWIYRASQPR